MIIIRRRRNRFKYSVCEPTLGGILGAKTKKKKEEEEQLGLYISISEPNRKFTALKIEFTQVEASLMR